MPVVNGILVSTASMELCVCVLFFNLIPDRKEIEYFFAAFKNGRRKTIIQAGLCIKLELKEATWRMIE